MSIKPEGTFINSDLYSLTWKDELYNTLWQYLIDNNVIRLLTERGLKKDERGENSNCIYYELMFWEFFIDYLILMKDEATKNSTQTQAEFDAIIESYDIDCIKKKVRCDLDNVFPFNKLVIMTNLYTRAGIGNAGLDFMIFDSPTDTNSDFIIA